MAIAHCNVPLNPTNNPLPMHVRMNGQAEDELGWAHPLNANAANLLEQLNDPCAGPPLHVDDTIQLGNGVTNSQVFAVADILNGVAPGAKEWPYDDFPAGPPAQFGPYGFGLSSLVLLGRWGFTLGHVVPLVDVGGSPGNCSGAGNMNGSAPIVGFARGFFYDARLGDAAQKGFMFQLDVLQEQGP